MNQSTIKFCRPEADDAFIFKLILYMVMHESFKVYDDSLGSQF